VRGNGLAISPSGRFLAFHDERPAGVAIIDLATGVMRMFGGDAARDSVRAPRKSRVAFVDAYR